MQKTRPRADLLWYPRYRWASVLVRRTHDLALAWDLAHACWADVDDDRPLATWRVGWWVTYTGMRVPARAAQDRQGRVVRHTSDDREPGAGPGIEFRP